MYTQEAIRLQALDAAGNVIFQRFTRVHISEHAPERQMFYDRCVCRMRRAYPDAMSCECAIETLYNIAKTVAEA